MGTATNYTDADTNLDCLRQTGLYSHCSSRHHNFLCFSCRTGLPPQPVLSSSSSWPLDSRLPGASSDLLLLFSTPSGLYSTSCTLIHCTACWNVETLLFKLVKSCSQTLQCLFSLITLAPLWDPHTYLAANMLTPEPWELCSSTFWLVSNITIPVVKYF